MLQHAIPQLPSLDLDRSVHFYVNKLKFTLKNRYPGFLILSKDNIELHFWLCQDPAIPQSSSVYFRVSDIDALYEEHERLGIVHPNAHLEDKPWGIREFHSLDPDGNLLKFGASSMS
jgi:catechol 2,3-dioxygenase-like lactoylglutathione lyase family enzyme